MKIVYIILCHNDPSQVIRLIRALTDKDVFFVVHVDARASEEVYLPLQEFSSLQPDVFIAPRVSCYWGSFGIVQATLTCLREALRNDRTFDYAILLSGQDYPIKTRHQIAAFLRENHGKEFIESFSLLKPNRWSEHQGIYNASARVSDWYFFFRSRCFHLKLPRQFPLKWIPHGGSQWWCLSKECILYIDSLVRQQPSVARYFRHVFIPDECFFQSILSNSPFRDRLVNDHLRYIDWECPNPKYPRTLEACDFDKLAASPKLFARKFQSARSKECLDRIDEELIETMVRAG
jgi:Core-2/I-Branching enzyme